MTNRIGNEVATTAKVAPTKAPKESSLPFFVTGRHLQQVLDGQVEILDQRDKKRGKTLDDFKVEIVGRLGEQQKVIVKQQEMLDGMQELLVKAMALIKVNNILQPQAESVQTTYRYEVNGWLYECDADEAARMHARGEAFYRDITLREKVQANEQDVRDAAEVLEQLRRVAA